MRCVFKLHYFQFNYWSRFESVFFSAYGQREREREHFENSADRYFFDRRGTSIWAPLRTFLISRSHGKSGTLPWIRSRWNTLCRARWSLVFFLSVWKWNSTRRSSISMRTRNSALKKWIRRRKFNIITLGKKIDFSSPCPSSSPFFLHLYMWKVIESNRPSEYFIPSPADDHNKNFLFSFDHRERRREKRERLRGWEEKKLNENFSLLL